MTFNRSFVLYEVRPIRLFWNGLRRFAQLWERPAASAVLALVVYSLFAVRYRNIWAPSEYPYHTYLADSLLHGQLYLRLTPPSTYDLTLYEGKYYLNWGPLPAILLMPFVAIVGVQFSDIAFTLAVAAFNVALIALVLRQSVQREIIQLSQTQRGLLVLFFALGTVHVTLAPFGRVWFTTQLLAFSFVALAYLAALSLNGNAAFLATGGALACVLLTRSFVVLAGVWPLYYLLVQHWSEGFRRRIGYVFLGLLPILAAAALLAMYNWLRFQSISETGLTYHLMHPLFVDSFQRYGAFNLRYVPQNIFYQYLFYPFPLRPTSFVGGSLFLLSPVFLGAAWALRTRGLNGSTFALLAAIGLVATPIILHMATGAKQFGPRYTLDFTVPLLLLAAVGIQRWPVWLLALLTLISIVQYIYGTLHYF